MATHHLNLSSPVRVSDVLTTFAHHLGAEYTGYAGTGHDARDGKGNTLLELFSAENRVLYFIDPYAGYLPTIRKELTRRVSIENVQGDPLDDEWIAFLGKGLEQLAPVTGTFSVRP